MLEQPRPRRSSLTFLLAFTVAGYNIECIRSFSSRRAVEAEATAARKKRRTKRRQGPGRTSSTEAANAGPTLRRTDPHRLKHLPPHQGRRPEF